MASFASNKSRNSPEVVGFDSYNNRVLICREVGCDVFGSLAIMNSDEHEHKYSNFGATYLKYRKIVAEWMMDVCDFFCLHSTTKHAAISYLDRLQPNEKYTRFEWQMLAICCILISSKYNESEEHLPDLSSLEDITQQAISNEEVLNHELWALQRLAWKLNARTTMAFLSTYTVIGIIYPKDNIRSGNFTMEQLNDIVSNHFNALATLSILEEKFKPFKCSLIAAAIVLYTRRLIRVFPEWNDELRTITTYDVSALTQVVELLQFASFNARELINLKNNTKKTSTSESVQLNSALQSDSTTTSTSSDPVPQMDESFENCMISSCMPMLGAQAATPEQNKDGGQRTSPVGISDLISY